MQESQAEFWNMVMRHIQESLSPTVFDTIIKRAKLLGVSDDKIVIGVPYAYMIKRLSFEERKMIDAAASRAAGRPMTVSFLLHEINQSIKSTKIAIEAQNLIAKRKELTKPKSGSNGGDSRVSQGSRRSFDSKEIIPQLNPLYRFDNFITGDSNNMAHAASKAVSERPAEMYNPLFIYGGVGLGKTHLLHAIGHSIEENFPEKTVRLCVAETYTNELIDAIGDKESLRRFRAKYRHCDTLLIDDIHFLIDKEATQEAFFHNFNVLYGMNKQIVVTSDRHPHELRTLNERLINRFQLGLIVDIQKPSYETRLAILRKKAQLMNINVPSEILEVFAADIRGSIRSLEGCLRASLNIMNSNGRDVTVEEAREIAESYSHERDLKQKPITIKAILDLICHHYRITLEELQSSSRESKVAHPRHVGMYLAKKYTSHSLKEIARAFKRKDHATVHHGYKKIENNIGLDAILAREISYVEDLLLGKSPLE